MRARLLAIVSTLMASVASGYEWREVPTTRFLPRPDTELVYDPALGRSVLLSVVPRETWELDGVSWTSTPTPAAIKGGPMTYHAGHGRVFLVEQLCVWERDATGWRAGALNPEGLPRSQAIAYDASRDRVVMLAGAATWEHDGVTWIAKPVLPGDRVLASPAMAYDPPRQRIVLFGGAAQGLRNDTWEFDGTTWTAGATAPPGLTPRVGSAMVFDAGRGALVLFGGRVSTGTLTNETWLHDGTAWSAGPAAPWDLAGRTAPAMTYDAARDRVVVFGGQGVSFPLNDIWELSGSTWARGVEPAGLPARYFHAMAWCAQRGRVVLFGGSDGAPRGDTWELDGTSWVPGAIAPPGLSPRFGHTMTDDSARGVAVLFGGWSDAALADTWELDAAGWRAGAAPPAGLTPRRSHAAAYDATAGRTLIHGGNDGASILADLWALDGNGWTQLPSPPAALGPRASHAMAHDGVRARTVLFGGYDGSALRQDTWEHDGATWALSAATGPTVLAEHAMAYDARRGLVVMAGGATPYPSSESWEFDGTGWTLLVRPSTKGPGSHTRAGLSYDPAAGRTVLCGGLSADGFTLLENDTWELLPHEDLLAGAGPGPACENRFRGINGAGAPTPLDVVAYAAGTYGVLVATGDVDGAGHDEAITGPGPGPVHGPQVRAFDVAGLGTPLPKVNFYAYGTLKSGVNVGAGSTDADAYEELLTGAGPGFVFGPHVRGFDYDASAVAPIPGINFFAYATPRYGVDVGEGDVDGDGYREILTGPGPSSVFGPQVRGFDVDGGQARAIAGIQYLALPTGGYGVHVAGGDAGGDGRAEIAAGAGSGPGIASDVIAHGYDGTTVAALPGFAATVGTKSYGARVSWSELAGDGGEELVTGWGPDPTANAWVVTYAYDGTRLSGLMAVTVFLLPYTHGATVAGGDLGH